MSSDDLLVKAGFGWLGLAYLTAVREDLRLLVVLGLLALSAGLCARCAPTVLNALRVVTAWTTLAWASKFRFVGFSYHMPGGVLTELDEVFADTHFEDPYFWGPLGDPTVLAWVFAALWGLGVLALLVDDRRAYRAYAAVAVLLSGFTLVHQWGFAVQMATTTLWVCLWLFWLANREIEDGVGAATLGQMAVAFIFLGPALGKLTAGYTTGETTLALEHQSPFPFEWFHMGRQAIAFEGLAGVSFLLPPRWASLCILGVITGMVSTFGVALIEPLAPPVGACLATWILVRGAYP